MKCTTIIDPTRPEEVLIYLHRESAISQKIEAILTDSPSELTAQIGDTVRLIHPEDVTCFISEGGRILAIIENERAGLRLRLYELEELLGEDFIRINQSCLANIKKIERFEASFGGALCVRFKGGYTDYVSRRQLKTVKERIGIKRK